MQKNKLMEMEDLLPCSRAAVSRCVYPPSCFSVLTQYSRAYVFTLIVRSQAVDPLRTPNMIKEEEAAREYFEETKGTLQLFCPCGWMDHFQKHVEDFIQVRLLEATSIMAMPGAEEKDSIRLHGLRRLIAGAVQEGELVRQPEYAATCAMLDGAIVWGGRGYVIKTHSLYPRLIHLPRINLRKFRQRYSW